MYARNHAGGRRAPLRFFFPRHLLCTDGHLGSRQAPVSPVRTTTTQPSCLFGTWAGGTILSPGDTNVSRGTAGDGDGDGEANACACVLGTPRGSSSPPPSRVTIARGHTRPRVCNSDGEGPGGSPWKSRACVRPSVRRNGREGTRPMPRSAQPGRLERWLLASLFSLPGRSGCCQRRSASSVAGRWVACRIPAVIRDWGDPWPVASARGIRSPSQEILGSASLLCIPHDCFSHTLGPLGEAGRGKAEPDPGQLMGSGYFHFRRGCCRWMVFAVLVGAVASHWPIDEAWCLVLFGLAVGAGGRNCPRL